MVYIFGGHDLNVAAEYFAQKQLFAGSQIEERLRAVERVYLDAVAKALRGSVRRQRKWLRSTWTSIFYLLIQYIYIFISILILTNIYIYIYLLLIFIKKIYICESFLKFYFLNCRFKALALY